MNNKITLIIVAFLIIACNQTLAKTRQLLAAELTTQNFLEHWLKYGEASRFTSYRDPKSVIAALQRFAHFFDEKKSDMQASAMLKLIADNWSYPRHKQGDRFRELIKEDEFKDVIFQIAKNLVTQMVKLQTDNQEHNMHKAFDNVRRMTFFDEWAYAALMDHFASACIKIIDEWDSQFGACSPEWAKIIRDANEAYRQKCQ